MSNKEINYPFHERFETRINCEWENCDDLADRSVIITIDGKDEPLGYDKDGNPWTGKDGKTLTKKTEPRQAKLWSCAEHVLDIKRKYSDIAKN